MKPLKRRAALHRVLSLAAVFSLVLALSSAQAVGQDGGVFAFGKKKEAPQPQSFGEALNNLDRTTATNADNAANARLEAYRAENAGLFRQIEENAKNRSGIPYVKPPEQPSAAAPAEPAKNVIYRYNPDQKTESSNQPRRLFNVQ